MTRSPDRLKPAQADVRAEEILLEVAEINARTADALAAAIEELRTVRQTNQALFDQATELLVELRRLR